ncbi:hypothetical protein GOV13_01995 [Candidatus Pacearchaeota archaeon]|nr:hypothetical protein [Candidatus Pacearchaeota archaeon]
MEHIFLRGHHSEDFWDYVFYKDKGKSHISILKNAIKTAKYFESLRKNIYRFERHTNDIFRKLYNNEIKNITLTRGLDIICLGPYNSPPGEWCSVYSKGNCEGEDPEGVELIKDDLRQIEILGYQEDSTVPVSDFVRRVREIPKEVLIYFSPSELIGKEDPYEKLRFN